MLHASLTVNNPGKMADLDNDILWMVELSKEGQKFQDELDSQEPDFSLFDLVAPF